MDTIGKRIRARRKELALTMQQLHEKIGLSTGNISELENDKYAPSLATLLVLSSALNCSIDWLVTGIQPDALMSEYNEAQRLSELEIDLINSFRRLDVRDQAELIVIAKMKADRAWAGNKGISSTLSGGSESTSGTNEDTVTA